MKNISHILLVVFAISLLTPGCEKEEQETTGKAVFSYVTDGFLVTFTNFTFGADDYEWDFDDGSEVSTDTNPVHIYQEKGVYMVSLTAYTNGEVSNFTDSVIVYGPNIKIDGDFMDWEYVDVLYEHDEGNDGTLKLIKGYVDAANVNLYIEGSDEMNFTVMSIYIDSDNDPNTGFQSWQYPAGSGADFYLEGGYNSDRPQDSWGSIYDYTGSDGGWGWTPKLPFSDGINFSKMSANNGKRAFELSLSRSALDNISGAINFSIFELNAGWTVVGEIPLSVQDTSKYLKLEF